jgi:hypothetical protein
MKDRPEDTLTYEVVSSVVSYNPVSGKITRIVATSQNTRAGQEAGFTDSLGYITLGILGCTVRAHRVAYLLMTKTWPPKNFQIDHIDGIKSNNAWANLRLATAGQNRCNVAILKTNSSGVKGVSWFRLMNKWRVYVTKNGKQYSGGYYETLQDAKIAVRVLREKLHKDFTNNG